MPRLKQAGREAGNPFANQIFDLLFEDRDPIAEPGTATGTPGNWWTVFNIVPDAFKHTTEGFQFYRSKNRKLDPKLRELGQIRAGFAVGSQFVFSQHCKASRDVGLTEDQIAAIPHWQVADCFSPLERAVLAYTDGLVLQRGRRWCVRGAESGIVGRGNPRIHLHHLHLYDARHHEPCTETGI